MPEMRKVSMTWRFFRKKADNQGRKKIRRQQQQAFGNLVIFHVLLVVEGE